MARLFKDLLVDEQDGKIRVNLLNRDGTVALHDVSLEVSSPVVQQGDDFGAAAANKLLRLDDDDRPQLAIQPQEVGGLATYTHTKSGTVHTLTGSGDNIRFVATEAFAAGDTIKVNGTACTAKTAAGDTLWTGFFSSGAVVVCYRVGDALNFNAGGLPAAAKAKLTPANIKTGVHIQGGGVDVTGAFTADATAAANEILAGRTAYVNGAKVTGTAMLAIYLGQGRSFNVSVYSGYKQFTASDFVAEMLPLSGEAGNGHQMEWWTNESAVTCRGNANVAKSYNANTGIFTCNGSLAYSGNDESWSYASGSAASDCKVWLLIKVAT